MPTESRTPDADRFRPHATREMAGMFDDVSESYDLLNRVMTLGQDSAWRAAMGRAVPEEAHVCLDLCTGNGVSLAGLRRPGRLLIGIDVSLGMLQRGARALERRGWSPRLICADAFHLPLSDRSVDAITVAFGVRNLRPRREALAEMRRVLREGGTLAVLEAVAPAGALAPLHGFALRRLIPLAGRLSKDPSAYEYLSRSVFEFGAGSEFEGDLEAAGFSVVSRRTFLMGASRLWTVRGESGLQNAREGPPRSSEMPQSQGALDAERRGWLRVQAVTAGALTAGLAMGIVTLATSGSELPLAPWQRAGLWALLISGLVGFGLRTLFLAGLWRDPPSRR